MFMVSLFLRDFKSKLRTTKLSLPSHEGNNVSTKSRFTMIVLPITKVQSINSRSGIPTSDYYKQQKDDNGIEKHRDDLMNKCTLSFCQVVAQLGNLTFPERCIDYRGSPLTYLLEDVLGGNCKTAAIFCLKVNCCSDDAQYFNYLATNMAKVLNFPVVNTELVQKLLTQHRARAIFNSRNSCCKKNCQLGQHCVAMPAGPDCTPMINVNKISDKSKFYLTEDEKCSILDTISSLRLQTESLKYERDNLKESFDLYRKHSEVKVSDLERQVHDLEKEISEGRTMLSLEKDFSRKLEKKLEEVDCGQLRARYNSLVEEVQKQKIECGSCRSSGSDADVGGCIAGEREGERLRRRNEKLKGGRCRCGDGYDDVIPNGVMLKLKEVIKELKDVVESSKKQLNSLSDVTLNLRHCGGGQQSPPPGHVIKMVDSAIDELKSCYNIMKSSYQNQIKDQSEELNLLKLQMRDTQKKLSQLTARYLICERDRTILETENTTVQNRLKKCLEDCRRRINKMAATEHMSRESQLTQAVHFYKRKLAIFLNKHERLLVAYRDIYEQVKAKNIKIDPSIIHDYLDKVKNVGDNDVNVGQKRADKILKTPSLGKKGDNNKKRVNINDGDDDERERVRLLKRNYLLKEEIGQLQKFKDEFDNNQTPRQQASPTGAAKDFDLFRLHINVPRTATEEDSRDRSNEKKQRNSNVVGERVEERERAREREEE
ncbi:hypothetical protein HELRODRAFT_164772 [Helobdella robusta]|uniref:Kinesin motor domain-containing protein n=1 Tax=Helobdella robusta TaxID=6412 RepID=T1EVS7_HELRO|nr:hypothetical protein HELRODRAFT_164772 [Helobdella robusta]ESN92685.1 hypothetical protein HELRODRAFT_164772 [Helobdella robusta]